MNTPNPLMPQGSLEAQATDKRSMIKIVVSTILAVHGVVLGGLLFLGCKEETTDPNTELANASFQDPAPIEQEEVDPFASLLPDTGQPITIPGSDDEPIGTARELPPLPPSRDPDQGFVVASNNPGLPGTFPGDVPRGNTNENTFIPTEPEPPVGNPSVREPYIVLPGDNFTIIARKHGLKVSQIAAANPGVDSRRLQVGQELNLPPNVPAVTPSVPEAGTENQTGMVQHTVVSGDTLFRLADRYGVKVKQIQEANNIKGSTIRVGQKLDIPIPNNQ